jgi:hypothetical protein
MAPKTSKQGLPTPPSTTLFAFFKATGPTASPTPTKSAKGVIRASKTSAKARSKPARRVVAPAASEEDIIIISDDEDAACARQELVGKGVKEEDVIVVLDDSPPQTKKRSTNARDRSTSPTPTKRICNPSGSNSNAAVISMVKHPRTSLPDSFMDEEDDLGFGQPSALLSSQPAASTSTSSSSTSRDKTVATTSLVQDEDMHPVTRSTLPGSSAEASSSIPSFIPTEPDLALGSTPVLSTTVNPPSSLVSPAVVLVRDPPHACTPPPIDLRPIPSVNEILDVIELDDDDLWETGDDELLQDSSLVDDATPGGEGSVKPGQAQADLDRDTCPVCQSKLSSNRNVRLWQILRTDTNFSQDAESHVMRCVDGLSDADPSSTAPPTPSSSKSGWFNKPSNMNVTTSQKGKQKAGASGNAFSMLMSSFKENDAWKEATVAEDKKFRPTKENGGRRKAPFYKVMQGMPIAVDAFKYGAIPNVTAYFLTHAHSDHYTNLSANWKNGPIYCSGWFS